MSSRLLIALAATSLIAACTDGPSEVATLEAPLCDGVEPLIGIDVSHWQGDIDWVKVAGEAGQQVVHHLVGQEHAAAIGLAAQRGTQFGLGQRLQCEHMAPAQARAQVLAQRQVDRRHAPGGGQGDVVRGGVDEQREGGMLACVIELVAVVDHHQRPALVDLPGQRRGRLEPAAALALLVGAAHQRAQQVGLAGAARPPQVADRRSVRTALRQVGHRGAVWPGQVGREALLGSASDRADGQRQLLHPRYRGLAR